MSALRKMMTFAGEAIGFFMAAPCTMLGWIPHFTGMSMGCFLIGDAVLAIVFAWMIME